MTVDFLLLLAVIGALCAFLGLLRLASQERLIGRSESPAIPRAKALGAEIPTSAGFLLFVFGVLAMVPKVYVEVFAQPADSYSLSQGFGLCELKPFSPPANLGSEGIDDDTAVALFALLNPPSVSREDRERWSQVIGEVLRREPEIREALQTAILRANYTEDTLQIYCEAKDRTVTEMTAEEARVFTMINEALGYDH